MSDFFAKFAYGAPDVDEREFDEAAFWEPPGDLDDVEEFWPEGEFPEPPPDYDDAPLEVVDFEPANSVDEGPANSVEPSKQRAEVDDGPANSVEPAKQRPDVDSEPLRSSVGGGAKPSGNRVLPSPKDPWRVASELLREWESAGRPLRFWRGAWVEWCGGAWRELADHGVVARAYAALADAVYPSAAGMVPWQPTRTRVGDVVDALKAAAILDAVAEPGSWLGDGPHPTGTFVSVKNGLLRVEDRTLLPHDRRFFNFAAAPFDYDPDAPKPKRWLEFLDSLWDDDEEKLLLQEFFGYVVSGRTDLQKILLMVGPTRAGKGTVARVLRNLVGPQNYVGPTLASLSSSFGLAPLIGKSVAVIPDARISGRADAVVERLLAISGEDAITVDRKFRSAWTGRISARLVIISNELPRLSDTSAALMGRFLPLILTKSFFGAEDLGLERALAGEIPAIFNWALDGLDRLNQQGRFTMPRSGQEALATLAAAASPIRAFVNDEVVIDPSASVTIDGVWTRWKAWAENNSQPVGSKQGLARALHAAIPGLRTLRPRGGDSRIRHYAGIRLISHAGGGTYDHH